MGPDLYAELAEAEVSTARTAEELRDPSHEWIEEIESDLNELEQPLPQASQAQATQRSGVDLHRDDLWDMRERVQEIRSDVEEALAERENLEDDGEDIARDLGELVQDVREARYRLEWSHPTTAGR